MRKRFVAPVAAMASAGRCGGCSTGVASAHTPFASAEVICDEAGQPVIEFVSVAWGNTSKPARENPHIAILSDGTVVLPGADAPPDYTSSGSARYRPARGAATPWR